MYAPWMSVSTPTGEHLDLLDREIETIATVVAELGPVDAARLARTTGAGSWGPGRFRTALREAVAEGRVVRLPGRRFGPPDGVARG